MATTRPFIPTCRYDHGEMEPMVNTFGTDWFAVQAVDKRGLMNFSGVVLRVYKCQTCTYTELHDVDQVEFDAKVEEFAAMANAQKKAGEESGGSS